MTPLPISATHNHTATPLPTYSRAQVKKFEAELELLKLQPTSPPDGFKPLVMFIAACTPSYIADMAWFPQAITDVLVEHGEVLPGDMRRTLAQAMFLLRNRGVILGLPVIQLCFKLFRLQDKLLRELCFTHVINDMKFLNQPGVTSRRKAVVPAVAAAESNRAKVNAAVQSFLAAVLHDDNVTAARKALEMLIELHRRKVWKDAKTVNLIASMLTAPQAKLAVPACQFFLGADLGDDEDEDDEAPARDPSLKDRSLTTASDLHLHSKKTRKRMRQASRHVANMRKHREVTEDELRAKAFPAIAVLHDPQGLVEGMLSSVRRSSHGFEVRLMLLNVITRIVGQHKLALLNLYSYLQRFLTAHQQRVTAVLAYTVQSCHTETPPEELAPIIRSIANNFITDRNPPEVMQVGLNALREIFDRAPAVLAEPDMDDLVQDLVLYRKDKDKGVVMAARAVLNAIREHAPALLMRKDRGKGIDGSVGAVQFGASQASSSSAELKLLAAYFAVAGVNPDSEEGWKPRAQHPHELERDSDEESSSDEELPPERLYTSEDVDVVTGHKRGRFSKFGPGDTGADEDEDDDDDESAGAAAEEPAEGSDGDDGIAMHLDDEDDDEDDDDEDEDDDEDDDDEDDDDEEPGLTGPVPPLPAGYIFSPRDFDLLKQLRREAIAQVAKQRGKRDAVGADDPQVAAAVAHVYATEPEFVKAIASSRAAGGNESAVVSFDPDTLESDAVLKRRAAKARLDEADAAKGDKWKPDAHAGGLTNREKARQKNFLMVRKSSAVQAKFKQSLADQQKSLRKHMKNLSKQTKHDKRKRRRT